MAKKKQKTYKAEVSIDLVEAFKGLWEHEKFEILTVLFKELFLCEQIELITRLYEALEKEDYQDEVTEWIVEDQSWMQAEKLKASITERWGRQE